MPSSVRRPFLLAAGTTLLLAGCSSDFGAPDPATEQGGTVLDLYRVLLLLSAIVGLVVFSAIGWSLVRYRKRAGDDDLPPQRHGHTVIEAIGVAVPLAMVAGLFAYILYIDDLNTEEAADPDVRLEVTGYRWGWRFHFPDEAVTIVAGPGEEPEVVLPVDATVRFRFETSDVLHSFYVPHFLTKRDLIPGRPSEIDLDLTRTGTFDGHCAEFCGLDHARMNFVVRIDGAAAYEAWLDDHRDDEA